MPTLHWIGKEKVINHHHDVPFRLLKKQYAFQAKEGTPENSTGNRIIHGDNLEALKSLLPEFEGRINCIYIDPPYNTGNEGWVYNDNVNDPKIKKWLGEVVGKEGEDLSRHDKWLCMMYPRLKLLHRLLAEDGVIFISIDDNEQANLKLLMDEIWGYFNFIGSLIQNKINAKNDSINIQKNHEFILVYRKSERKIDGSREVANLICYDYKVRDIFKDNNTYYYLNDPITTRGEGGVLSARPNLGYTVYYHPGTNDKKAVFDYDKKLAKISNDVNRVYTTKDELVKQGYIPVRPPKVRGMLGSWTWDIDKFKAEKNNIVVTGKNPSLTLRKRTFVDISNVYKDGGKLKFNQYIDSNTKSILEFSTNEGTNLLNAIMGSTSVFNNPKNMEMIKYLIQLLPNKNAFVLDSFSGSGTTAHAVLKLNAEDGGNRRFICVEMMDYAETITAERVRRVMDGYGEDKKAVGGLGGGFDYYTVDMPLFIDGHNLNEEVGAEAIRHYVAYTEGIPSQAQLTQDNTISPYALGVHNDALYAFYYERERITTLGVEFLNTLNLTELKPRPSGYIVYADKCAVNDEFLLQHGIVFKRIPRDISRL